MSFRKEIKYRLTISDFILLKNKLLKIGMDKLYEMRNIHSLYYDTAAYSLFEDSEEGVVPRKKIRYRWYDSLKEVSIEKKISSIEGRYKTKNQVTLINNNFPSEIHDQYYGILTPSLLVTYQREYYTLKKMRLTFDSSIEYENRRLSSKSIFKDTERVMEIKVNNNISNDYIAKFIPYTQSRFSKYSRGILISRGNV